MAPEEEIIHKVYAYRSPRSHQTHILQRQLATPGRKDETPTQPQPKQYIWGNRYIDDLVLRDHDTNERRHIKRKTLRPARHQLERDRLRQ